jgi:hypothetical protein
MARADNLQSHDDLARRLARLKPGEELLVPEHTLALIFDSRTAGLDKTAEKNAKSCAQDADCLLYWQEGKRLEPRFVKRKEDGSFPR